MKESTDAEQAAALVRRVAGMTEVDVAYAVEHNHPSRLETQESYAADDLAMRLIHGRYGKRDIVNLLRWVLMGCPTYPEEPS